MFIVHNLTKREARLVAASVVYTLMNAGRTGQDVSWSIDEEPDAKDATPDSPRYSVTVHSYEGATEEPLLVIDEDTDGDYLIEYLDQE